MPVLRLDISSVLSSEDGLPHPQWDLVRAWIERLEAAERSEAWNDIVRQWLVRLAPALGSDYHADEDEHFFVLAHAPALCSHLFWCAGQCRHALLDFLPGVTDLDLNKLTILAIHSHDDYYRYVAHFFPDGEHGGSGGMHIRAGMPHVVLQGKNASTLERALAHEMTHVSLAHLSLPCWVEEGLAQIFEKQMTHTDSEVLIDGEGARKQKQHWSKNGLDAFWCGAGFSAPGKMQEHSYKLAEILVRLLFSEFRPRWFGMAKEPQRRLLAFLRQAQAEDCGAGAARQHLGFGLGDLAGRFLGEGHWEPGPEIRGQVVDRPL